MPFKDLEYGRRRRRCSNRTRRYGNWRQIYIDCAGVCVVCGNPFELEFHETPNEDTVLLCHDCHDKELNTQMYFSQMVNRNYQRSVLTEDVQTEIEECGGYSQWLSKYNLTDETFGRLTRR